MKSKISLLFQPSSRSRSCANSLCGFVECDVSGSNSRSSLLELARHQLPSPLTSTLFCCAPELSMISATDETKTLVDEGRRLRSSGDRAASLQAFKQAAQIAPSNATAIIECGYDHLELKQIAEAQAAFEQGLTLDPDNKAALIGLGHTFRHLRRLDDAERAFRRVLELEPAHAGANMGLGYTLKSLGRRDEALEAFQTVAGANPSNIGASVETANLLRELGRTDQAIAAFRDIVEREPSNAGHLAALGRLLKQTGKNVEATEIFRRLVAAEPSTVGFRIELGQLLRDMDQFDGALDLLNEAVHQAPQNANAWIALGWLQRRTANLDQAAQAFRQALILQPANLGAMHGLGLTERQRANHEASLALFSGALQIDPTRPLFRLEVCKSLKELQRFDDAIEQCRQLLAEWTAGAQDESTRIEAVKLLIELGRANDAIALLSKIVEQEPSHNTNLATLGRLARQAGDKIEASKIFRKLVAAEPANVGFRVELGELLRDIEEFDEASDVLNEAVRQEPDRTNAWTALGWLHRRTRDLNQAAAAFEQAMRLEPTNVGAMHGLGLTERERGNHQASNDLFVKARQIDPKRPLFRLEICKSLQELRRFDDAIAEYRQILLDLPTNKDAYLGLGHALHRCGQTNEAIASFDEATRVDQTPPSAAIEAGHLELRLGHPLEAEQRFRNALDHSPENASALVGLSHALRRQARMSEAEAALCVVRRAEPSNTSAQIALAQLLEAQYRLDEAAQLHMDLIASEPSRADSLVAIGNICRRRGNREQALDLFRKAAEATPMNKTRLIDVAAELRDLGRLEESEGILNDVLTALPGDPRAMMQQGYHLRRKDRREEALVVFAEILKHDPTNTQAMLEAATEERALGNPTAARLWLDNAFDVEVDHLGALLACADLAMLEERLDAALSLYERATAAHPSNIWTWLGRARVLFELGRRDEAFETIAEGRKRLGPHPEFTIREVELLRDLREWKRAQLVLRDAMAQTLRPNLGLWSHEVQISTLTGQYEVSAALLENAPASTIIDRARVALLKGQLAERQFAYEPAIAHYREAIQHNPSDAWPYFELARATLMHLDIANSKAALTKFVEASKSPLLLRKQSLNLSQNHVGQLIDEFMLDTEALAKLRQIRLLPLADQLGPLRQLLQQYPDYTPAAIITAIALRQHGNLTLRSLPAETRLNPIPQKIYQFWDSDPPEDVRALMASWRELNPAYAATCFDNEMARAFLQEEFGHDVLAAYERAPIPAQKADIFRLACLVARGGIYADADDRCLAPIDSFLRPDATLAVHQEDYGSIGNNFIAAVPEHPVLMRALELATAAMLRGDHDLVWLSTGPGLLTRAFAQEWAAGRPGGLLRRTQVMDLGELQRVVGIHCPVRYKSTERHWSRAAFGKGKRTRVTPAQQLSQAQPKDPARVATPAPMPAS